MVSGGANTPEQAAAIKPQGQSAASVDNRKEPPEKIIKIPKEIDITKPSYLQLSFCPRRRLPENSQSAVQKQIHFKRVTAQGLHMLSRFQTIQVFKICLQSGLGKSHQMHIP